MLTWLEDVTICTVTTALHTNLGAWSWDYDMRIWRIWRCKNSLRFPGIRALFLFLGARCSFLWSMLQGVCQKHLTEFRETTWLLVLSLLIAQKAPISCSISGKNFSAGFTSFAAQKWLIFLKLFYFASFASFASYLNCRTGTIRTLAFEALGTLSTRPAKASLPTPNVARQKHRSHQKADANQKIPFQNASEWHRKKSTLKKSDYNATSWPMKVIAKIDLELKGSHPVTVRQTLFGSPSAKITWKNTRESRTNSSSCCKFM